MTNLNENVKLLEIEILESQEEKKLRAYLRKFLRRTKSRQYANQLLNKVFGKCRLCGKQVENLRGRKFRGSSEYCKYHADRQRKRKVKFYWETIKRRNNNVLSKN